MAGLLKGLGRRFDRQSDASVVKKASRNEVVTPTIKGGDSLLDRINSITAIVSAKLGKYANKYQLLRTEEDVIVYFDKIIEIGEGGIDVESTSLNPMLCTLAGIVVYAPGLKPAYIPTGHVSHISGIKYKDQVSEEFLANQIQRCVEVKWYMHNADYDTRAIWHQLNIEVKCYWDTFLGAKCLNENEPANLKALHMKYCPTQDTEALTYQKLFEGIPFTMIPINTAYLYAAGDGVKSYELGQFQKKYLNEKTLPGPYRVFSQLEMPLVPVIADMEDAGIGYDSMYQQELLEKYTKLLKDSEEAFYKVLDMYKDEIETHKLRTPNHKLDDPVNIGSHTQIAVILYDILGLTSNDKKKPRGTGVDILEGMDTPLVSQILEYRRVAKLMSTYIENMPSLVNPNTGRIHTSYNQYGAVTGRFSSDSPNMQNIPAKNKDIRKMYIPTEGYGLISCDFSQQEPRILAALSNDSKLMQAYAEGRDIYAWIGSSIYHIPYEECKEFRPDGTRNPQGKKKRDSVKSILLGIMYGLGESGIAESLGITVKEAKAVINKFFTSFPDVKKYIDNTIEQVKYDGFVETAWGRKRRLPNMLLPEYTFKYKDGGIANFDPLAFDSGPISCEVPEDLVREYTKKLNATYSYKAKSNIKYQLEQQGITVKDNGGFIADASRQCVNSVIQGTAADVTKRAMILIGNDEEIKKLKGKMLLQVHDEIIAEGPINNCQLIAERMKKLMIQASAERIIVPMAVDIEITDRWYGKEVEYEE